MTDEALRHRLAVSELKREVLELQNEICALSEASPPDPKVRWFALKFEWCR